MEEWNIGMMGLGERNIIFVLSFILTEHLIGNHPLKPIFHHSSVPLFHLQTKVEAAIKITSFGCI
jgi:hypothetical protein